MPPVVLAALLAFHCSEQVCSRAKPGFSLAYFGSTAVGNTALPTGAAGAAGLASVAFGTAGAGAEQPPAPARGAGALPSLSAPRGRAEQGLVPGRGLPLRPRRTRLCGSRSTSDR